MSFVGDNVSKDGMADIPATIIMLTCDAFGVMPPISKLNSKQAVYHFLSGYTAKVAGTDFELDWIEKLKVIIKVKSINFIFLI